MDTSLIKGADKTEAPGVKFLWDQDQLLALDIDEAFGSVLPHLVS